MVKKNKQKEVSPEATKTAAPAKVKFDKILALIVFTSGACLMAFELVGSRILAPVFGSSIYTWGSLLAVFMLALSIGYFFGGKLADKKPSFATLTIIIAIAGFGVILVPLISSSICHDCAGLTQKWGSLVASLVLFGPPSIFMGMVSPLAIRLQARELTEVGNVAGTLYAISTIGSIVGTFASAFFLIEAFGMAVLTKGIGAVLLLAALIALAKTLNKNGKVAKIVALAVMAPFFGGGLVAFAVPAPLPIDTYNKKLIATQDSPYNTLFIIDSDSYGGTERILQFNDRDESGFMLDTPHQSSPSFTYTTAMHAVFGAKEDIKKVLLIGGGGGVMPIEFVCAYKDIEMDCIEIDPGVIEYARKYFIS